jgi:DNA-binding GntR family transcriptional regulator
MVEGSRMSADRLYAQLRSEVLNGNYTPGMPLVESAVAEGFGVSRTPVREALRALERDGLLRQQGRHLVVRETTLEEVIEIYDLRIVLEGVAAEWAARSRRETDLLLLEVALENMRVAADVSAFEKATINHAFHDRLWHASHNSTLVDLLGRLEVHTRRYPEPTVSQDGRWAEVLKEHAEIIEAVRAQDSVRAGELSRAHMEAAKDLRISMVRRQHGH